MKVLVDLGMHHGTSAGAAALTPVICRPRLRQFLWQKHRFRAGVVDAEVDGVAVDDDAESDRKKRVLRLSASQ